MSKNKEDFYNDFKNAASPSDVEKIEKNLGGMNRGPIAKIWDDVQILFKLVKDPSRGWGSKMGIVGALIYLISPIDAIPDVIPLLGLTDDMAVLGLVIKQFRGDIEDYKRRHNL